ncbi:hypothetical protein H5410_025559 [Solanum commersonii]|uniref:Uncharacterized protein n=1 Tax=Solanum commersonii TaxID=4109 RepID=A0A9J5YTH0_SOLCO|nr:hypothetical protein H5410_025559 [Solanum commersonii]
MARISLTRLCLQEEDHELEKNVRSCDFWLWKDDYIDPRSKFLIPKLLGRIVELEHCNDPKGHFGNFSWK